MRFRLSGVRLAWECIIERPHNVIIGKGTIIDERTTLKGSVLGGPSLFIGKNCRIRSNCYISATNGILRIGRFVLIAHNSWIGGQGSTEIGDNTLIGPGVVIISSNHDLTSGVFPAMDAPEIKGEIKIGKNTWIGANSTIVPNVSIGSGCVISGGSVVTSDVPHNHLVAGNPAYIVLEIQIHSENLYKESYQ